MYEAFFAISSCSGISSDGAFSRKTSKIRRFHGHFFKNKKLDDKNYSITNFTAAELGKKTMEMFLIPPRGGFR